MFKKYIDYIRNNPEGYWFKRKIWGWGWTPVTWQGWLVVLVGVAFIAAGVYVAQTDDAPGAALLGVIIALVIIFGFGLKKGEKLKWQWGLPKDTDEDKK